ncbi:MAG: GNAT family N-acetyltransferase [Candidatus Dormibacteraceae bacterium]
MRSTPEEIREAVTCLVEGGWGTYRSFQSQFSFYSTYRRSFPFVALDGGVVVGTAVGTRYRRSGWVANVFTAPSMRGRGLGRLLTSTVIKRLREAGCQTILLASTDLGRPVYDALGFQLVTAYHELHGPALPTSTPLRPLRPLLPLDRKRLAALDRRVTGDDRGPLLARVLQYGWCLERGDDLAGAVLPTPWGSVAATLLPDATEEETLAIIRACRVLGGGPGGDLMLYPTGENTRARSLLHEVGFEELRTVSRMILGEPLQWLPQAVWSVFSPGLG